MMQVLLSTLTAMMMSQPVQAAMKMPELDVVKHVILEGSMLCQRDGNYGIDLTSDNGTIVRSDIILDHQCNESFRLSTNRNAQSFGLIAMMGDIPLSELGHFQAYTNNSFSSFDSYVFRSSEQVYKRMTYSVMINSPKARGHMFLRIEDVQGKKLMVSYKVTSYYLIQAEQDAAHSNQPLN